MLTDSAGRAVAVLEVTGARVLPLGEVDLAHAVGEGTGHRSVAGWRAAYEALWHGEESRAVLGDPGFAVDDATSVVARRFRVAEFPDPVAAAVAGELRLLEPAVRASREEAARLLDPEFTEIGASGRRWTREEMLAELSAMDGATPDGPRHEVSGMAGCRSRRAWCT